ncbi:MAG: hypothetical protein A3I66_10130 [Burkholderiales bacterium RIFCSPLOWO2_02_FULL_57_36]|nr:MAG: hypothetical protein A3I66_10130 [Burkholderiales bacterium RIFCSPLOWO2_02_FULL_57_36]
MSTSNFAGHGLRARLALRRFGWANSVACLLCAMAAASWAWGIPHLTAQLQVQQRALAHTQHMLEAAEIAPPVVQKPLAEERLTTFYNALGEKHYAEQQIKTLFAIAQKTGLALNQAEYKSAVDKNGRFHTYQIVIPVKGSYGAIRQFCEQTLLTIPFASLDEMGFKREAIASQAVEARLRFTLYLSDTPSSVPHIEAATASDTRS